MIYERCNMQIPDWLKPYLKNGAYCPDREFLRDLVPQSRLEAILKYAFLELQSTYEGFLVQDENEPTKYNQFVDSDNKKFMVINEG